jgi:hypothetical protein
MNGRPHVVALKKHLGLADGGTTEAQTIEDEPTG